MRVPLNHNSTGNFVMLKFFAMIFSGFTQYGEMMAHINGVGHFTDH